MLQREQLLATIGFDTAENEPQQVCCMIWSREHRLGFFSVPDAEVAALTAERIDAQREEWSETGKRGR